ncbi:MAG: MAPEG family protein [Planktomarina sp.]
MTFITTFYAIPLAFIYLILTARVIIFRRKNKIGLGDDGNKGLMKRMRAQSNFVETVPLALILLILIELNGQSHILVHVLGAMLLAGRVVHAVGFSARPPKMRWRSAGMLLTLSAIFIAAWALLLGLFIS